MGVSASLSDARDARRSQWSVIEDAGVARRVAKTPYPGHRTDTADRHLYPVLRYTDRHRRPAAAYRPQHAHRHLFRARRTVYRSAVPTPCRHRTRRGQTALPARRDRYPGVHRCGRGRFEPPDRGFAYELRPTMESDEG